MKKWIAVFMAFLLALTPLFAMASSVAGLISGESQSTDGKGIPDGQTPENEKENEKPSEDDPDENAGPELRKAKNAPLLLNGNNENGEGGAFP